MTGYSGKSGRNKKTGDRSITGIGDKIEKTQHKAYNARTDFVRINTNTVNARPYTNNPLLHEMSSFDWTSPDTSQQPHPEQSTLSSMSSTDVSSIATKILDSC